MGVEQVIDITSSQCKTVLALIQQYLPGVAVWAYGSRVKWTSRPQSDFDLVAFAPLEQKDRVSTLREAFEASDLPFRVDLFVWDEVPGSFRHEITKNHVVLVEAKPEKIKVEWCEMPFSEAVEVNPKVQITRGKKYPFVDMAAVSEEMRNVYAVEKREFKGGGSQFRDGDTLMARITPCLENGKIARYSASQTEKLAHGSTEFIVIRGQQNITSSDFAYYLTRWNKFHECAIGYMTGTSGRQRVPVDALSHIIVPIPPLPEQRAIAYVLGTLDDKIELNCCMSETLEEMARTLFKSWFVNFDPVRAKMEGRDTGLPKEIADLFPDRLVESKFGEIPKGWKERPLNKIAKFLNGLALQKFPPPNLQNSLPVIKIAELRNGISIKTDRASCEIPTEYIVRNGDFLFSWSGSLLAKFWAGDVGALNQHLFKVTSERYPAWFFSQWVYFYLTEFRNIASSKATTMGHIQRSHLASATAICPPDNVVGLLGKIFAPLTEKILKNSVESYTLEMLRDTSLPKLFSGEIQVKQSYT